MNAKFIALENAENLFIQNEFNNAEEKGYFVFHVFEENYLEPNFKSVYECNELYSFILYRYRTYHKYLFKENIDYEYDLNDPNNTAEDKKNIRRERKMNKERKSFYNHCLKKMVHYVNYYYHKAQENYNDDELLKFEKLLKCVKNRKYYN